MRWIAALITFAVAVTATVWAYRWAEPTYDDRASTGERLAGVLRADGYGIVVFCLTMIVVGALLQAPIAVRRRAEVGRGLLAALGFVGYLLLVAAAASLIAGSAPESSMDAGRNDPGALYGAALVCLLGGPALLTVGGAIFVSRDDDFPLPARILASALIGGIIGVPAIFLIGVIVGLQSGSLRPWVPADGAAFLFIGAIPVGGLLVLTAAVAASAVVKRGLPVAAMRERGAGVAVLAGIVCYFAVTALLGAQLGRILPAGAVTVAAMIWLVASGPVMGRVFARFRRD